MESILYISCIYGLRAQTIVSKEIVLYPGEQLCLCDEYSVPILTRVYQPIPITNNFRIFSTLKCFNHAFWYHLYLRCVFYFAQVPGTFPKHTYMEISLFSSQNLSPQISPPSSGDNLGPRVFLGEVQRIPWELSFTYSISCKFAGLNSASHYPSSQNVMITNLSLITQENFGQ